MEGRRLLGRLLEEAEQQVCNISEKPLRNSQSDSREQFAINRNISLPVSEKCWLCQPENRNHNLFPFIHVPHPCVPSHLTSGESGKLLRANQPDCNEQFGTNAHIVYYFFHFTG
ncbi:hypothetical protein AVEN_57634-1 [Araneus ventricosus]|uniref:Uncharacterized protein n=1 Tax=Araneus ventricosus TaxID=182803 RepID=A0A4Y2P142_ARAVE|nr:hypothetical protein AVEN_57634-1 [Araneus ventricosus]